MLTLKEVLLGHEARVSAGRHRPGGACGWQACSRRHCRARTADRSQSGSAAGECLTSSTLEHLPGQVGQKRQTLVGLGGRFG